MYKKVLKNTVLILCVILMASGCRNSNSALEGSGVKVKDKELLSKCTIIENKNLLILNKE